MPKVDLTLLDLTPEELDKLSIITDQDIVITHNFATKELDDRFKNLLVTRPADEEDNLGNG